MAGLQLEWQILASHQRPNGTVVADHGSRLPSATELTAWTHRRRGAGEFGHLTVERHLGAHERRQARLLLDILGSQGRLGLEPDPDARCSCWDAILAVDLMVAFDVFRHPHQPFSLSKMRTEIILALEPTANLFS